MCTVTRQHLALEVCTCKSKVTRCSLSLFVRVVCNLLSSIILLQNRSFLLLSTACKVGVATLKVPISSYILIMNHSLGSPPKRPSIAANVAGLNSYPGSPTRSCMSRATRMCVCGVRTADDLSRLQAPPGALPASLPGDVWPHSSSARVMISSADHARSDHYVVSMLRTAVNYNLHQIKAMITLD
jgi:hypothetical protein